MTYYVIWKLFNYGPFTGSNGFSYFACKSHILYSQVKMHGLYSREQARPSSKVQSSWARWIGLLCVALVLLAGFIQVAHTHPGQVDHEGCSLCNTAHQTVQSVALVTVAVTVHPVWRAAAELPVQRPRQKFLHKLANRPPPVSLIAA